MATFAQITSLFQNNPQAVLYADEGRVTIVLPTGQEFSYAVPSLMMNNKLQHIKTRLGDEWNLPEVERVISLVQFVRDDPDNAVSEDFQHDDSGSGDNLYEALNRYLQGKLGLTEAQVELQFMFA
jgi:hypothetical protein